MNHFTLGPREWKDSRMRDSGEENKWGRVRKETSPTQEYSVDLRGGI